MKTCLNHTRPDSTNTSANASPSLAYLLRAVLIAVTGTTIAGEFQFQPHKGLKPFEYESSAAPLPNYVPNAKWGTQAEPIRTMQKPLSPAESMQHLVTFPEFDAHLCAAEPNIAKPIWMQWDDRGRLWIAETVDYPNDMQAPGEGHDRIKICEDTDGDGKADKFTIFADKLSVATSFVFANGGVIVVHSGKTEFLKDTDGDGKADFRKDLFTGWGTTDSHAGQSNLRYGFDNWIWGVVGYSGFSGTVGGKEIRFGQGIYRFKADGSALEFIRSSNNNTWGLGWSEDGTVFGSTANGNASMYMPIANRYYEAVRGWSASRMETIADSQSFYPITEKVRQVDWHGKYTAGAGSALYTARNFPKEYWNAIQFVCEPTGHLMGKFRLEARGSDFVAHNERNFLASDDEWTSPICAEVGPDGALWMIDWYNYIIQHNPTPNKFNTGKGNAYETPLRDKTHGRIYRLVYRNAKLAPPMRLDKSSPQELVAALKNDNLLWRLHAQRLLIERGNKDIAPQLAGLIRNRSIDEVGLNPAGIHALWTMSGLGLFDEPNPKFTAVALDALKHPSTSVRRAALQVLPRNSTSLKVLLNSKLLNDPDAKVRLTVLLALSEMPASPEAGAAVFALTQRPADSSDRWIPHAATAAAARHDIGYLGAALSAKLSASLPGEALQVLRRISTHYAQGAPTNSILSMLQKLRTASPEMAVPVLDGFVFSWPENSAPVLTQKDKSHLNSLMDSLPEEARDRLLALVQRWGQKELFANRVGSILDSLARQTKDSTLPEEKRVAAARRYVALSDNPSSAQTVLDQITSLTSPTLADGLINALGASRQAETGNALITHWKEFTPAMRRTAIAALMRRADWTTALLDAVENRDLKPTDLAAEHWSQLRANPVPRISQRAGRLVNSTVSISADRQEIVNKLLPLAKQSGDPARGKEVFTATCANCHTFNGQGGKIGPELTGIATRDRADILIDILDPNRSVEANYRLWNATTKDGETLSGRMEAETQTSIEILDINGQKHVVQRQNISKLEPTQMSIMPNGFESIPENDLKSLLDYLTQPAH